jgi:hypothetical protein
MMSAARGTRGISGRMLFDDCPDQVWSGRAIQSGTSRRDSMSDLRQSITMEAVVENCSGRLSKRGRRHLKRNLDWACSLVAETPGASV